MVSLLANCNPGVIELFGLRPDHYLYVSPIGEELLKNKNLFLSKRAIHSFGGYAYSQLRRLDNKSARDLGQKEQENHILKSIENASYDFRTRYTPFPEDSLRLYIDESEKDDLDSEIFMDINLTRYPLRDYLNLWGELKNIVKEYAKKSRRNKEAIEHGKLAKHMMHLIRLYLMGIDLLEKKEIITYREKDHDLLMSLRNGDFLDSDQQPTPEFSALVDSLQVKFEEAARNSTLPDNPNYKEIANFLMSVNERVVRGDLQELHLPPSSPILSPTSTLIKEGERCPKIGG